MTYQPPPTTPPSLQNTTIPSSTLVRILHTNKSKELIWDTCMVRYNCHKPFRHFRLLFVHSFYPLETDKQQKLERSKKKETNINEKNIWNKKRLK